jgi:hypothetical protein
LKTLVQRLAVRSLISLLSFAACLACGGGTSPTVGITVAGAVYDLVRLDGGTTPFEYAAPDRGVLIQVTTARVELLFDASEPTYDFRQFRQPNDTSASVFRSAYRQRNDGAVQLIGSGTFPDGVNRTYVEGEGHPTADVLLLRTGTAFIYGQHDWDFRRRDR